MHKQDLIIFFIAVLALFIGYTFGTYSAPLEYTANCHLEYCENDYCINYPIGSVNTSCEPLQQFCIRQSKYFYLHNEYKFCIENNIQCNFDNLKCRWLDNLSVCSCVPELAPYPTSKTGIELKEQQYSNPSAGVIRQ